MKDMTLGSLRNVNLNLLTVFDSLMETRSATRTAEHLHMTQPGVSRKLAELRRLLGDPLFVVVKRQLQPTQRAIGIRPAIREALSSVKSVIESGRSFDPSHSRQIFRIASRNSIEVMLAPGLKMLCEQSAPDIRFSFLDLQGIALPARQLDDHDLDIAIGRFDDLEDRFQSVPLFDDDRVCLVRQGHPFANKKLTPRHLCDLQYVTTTHMAGQDNDLDVWLKKAGYQRNFVFYVSNMGHVPLLLMQTDMAVTVTRKLAAYLSRFYPLAILDIAFKYPKAHYSMVWHRSWDGAQSHQWLRQVIVQLLGSRR